MNNELLIGPISNQILHHKEIPISRHPQSRGASFCPSIPIRREIGPKIVAKLRKISTIIPAIKQWPMRIIGAIIIPVKDAEANEPIPWGIISGYASQESHASQWPSIKSREKSGSNLHSL